MKKIEKTKKKPAAPKKAAPRKKAVAAKNSLPPMSLSFEGSLASKTGTWRYLTPVYLNKMAPCNEACPAGEDVEAAMVLSGQEDFPRRLGENHPGKPASPGLRPGLFPSLRRGLQPEGIRRTHGHQRPGALRGRLRFQGREAVCPSGGEKEGESGRHRVRARPASLALTIWPPSGTGSPSSRPIPSSGECCATGFPPIACPRKFSTRRSRISFPWGSKPGPNARVGKDVKWEELKKFDAVFVAGGAWKSLPLGVPGRECRRGHVRRGSSSRKSIPGQAVDLGQRVAIIGGGNTAMDAARSALRLGAKPARSSTAGRKRRCPPGRRRSARPRRRASNSSFSSSPVRILSENGKVKGIECIKNLLGPPGKDGRREPRPIDEFQLHPSGGFGDLGHRGRRRTFRSFPRNCEKPTGSIPVDETGATSLKKVFAGGDIVAQPRTVSYAIGSGKKAAMAIDATLRGKDVAEALRPGTLGGKGKPFHGPCTRAAPTESPGRP